jgi:predicted  nucleic acid-binding Zn-ribbon protein
MDKCFKCGEEISSNTLKMLCYDCGMNKAGY